MSVKYKIKQFNQKGGNWDGMYYGRATMTGVMTLDELSEIIERNCSMKKSDVKAVIAEMIEVLHDALCDSKKVVLDGLGTFKAGLHSTMVETTPEFSNNNIKRIKVNFLPEYTVSKDGTRTYALLEGATVQKYDVYEDGVNDNMRG